MTGSSADAMTVMTMPTGSQLSGQGKALAPRKTIRSSARSTSPRTLSTRSPRRSIEKTRYEDDRSLRDRKREIHLAEELRSAELAYNFLHSEHECLQVGYSQLHSESGEEFRQMAHYNGVMQAHIQEMMQEDEGSTIRIEELEHKLRLAESTADHIYSRYRDLARESEQGQEELESVKSKMDNMSSELQGALGHIQKQSNASMTMSR